MSTTFTQQPKLNKLHKESSSKRQKGGRQEEKKHKSLKVNTSHR